ncbi:envelope glycoprotein 24, partial [Saimiriine betaherpesvirus 4]
KTDTAFLEVCWVSFVNVLVLMAICLLIYRCIVGFQDDIVIRTLDVLIQCRNISDCRSV